AYTSGARELIEQDALRIAELAAVAGPLTARVRELEDQIVRFEGEVATLRQAGGSRRGPLAELPAGNCVARDPAIRCAAQVGVSGCGGGTSAGRRAGPRATASIECIVQRDSAPAAMAVRSADAGRAR